MRQVSHPAPAENENAFAGPSRDAGGCHVQSAMPERPHPHPLDVPSPTGSEYYYHSNPEAENDKIYISKQYKNQLDQNNQMQVPQMQDLSPQSFGPRDDQHRATLFIQHVSPRPPTPPPTWPQDIWLSNQTCRVLYQPVLVLPNPPAGEAPPPPLRHEQAQPMQPQPVSEAPFLQFTQEELENLLAKTTCPPLAMDDSQPLFADSEHVPMYAGPPMEGDSVPRLSMEEKLPFGPQWAGVQI